MLRVVDLLKHAVSSATANAGLPPRPAAEIDPYLDAAERCVVRYGWKRTSPKDVAREAGVERTTIYRKLGPKDQIFRLLLAREVHRIIDHAAEVAMREERGPSVLVELSASTIEWMQNNPVLSKLLDDDPELVASFLDRGVPDLIERFAKTLAPFLAMAMKAGQLAERDPVAVTEWCVRIGLTAVVAPPPGPLRPFLAAVLVPLLTVERSEGGQSANAETKPKPKPKQKKKR